jgi:peptide deformylase
VIDLGVRERPARAVSDEKSGELRIVQYGHPALRQLSKKVGRVTQDVRDLVERMTLLMRSAHGLGLSANQIGIPRRVAVVEIAGELKVLIDPQIVSSKGEEAADEGCLSLPRLYGSVQRPTHVVVRAQDLSGKRIKIEAEGLLARALCHEIDHLNGKLFVDSVGPDTLYWLIGHTEEGEPVTRATGIEDALRVLSTARVPDE